MRKTLFIILLASICTPSYSSDHEQSLHVFQPGESAKASQVNANFHYLETITNNNSSAINNARNDIKGVMGQQKLITTLTGTANATADSDVISGFETNFIKEAYPGLAIAFSDEPTKAYTIKTVRSASEIVIATPVDRRLQNVSILADGYLQILTSSANFVRKTIHGNGNTNIFAQLHVSRDGVGPCCTLTDPRGYEGEALTQVRDWQNYPGLPRTADHTLGIAEYTRDISESGSPTGRRATITFHNIWESDAVFKLAAGTDSFDSTLVDTRDIADHRMIIASTNHSTSLEVANKVIAKEFVVQTRITTQSTKNSKKEITKSSYGLSEISAIQPVNFIYKTDQSNTRQLGLIAEDLENIIPEVVSHDSNGKVIGIDYSKLTVALVGAVKELRFQNNQLKARIEKLEAGKQ